MLEHFQTHRQILFDLTANYLDPLDGMFSRVAYLASLRDPATGRYEHERLAAMYGEQAVDQVVARCHEEMFERLLETPLRTQEEGLSRYLAKLPGSFAENIEHCRKVAGAWIPPHAPPYLTELYLSNVRALLALLLDNKTTPRSGT
jgi:hypothetical protein